MVGEPHAADERLAQQLALGRLGVLAQAGLPVLPRPLVLKVAQVVGEPAGEAAYAARLHVVDALVEKLGRLSQLFSTTTTTKNQKCAKIIIGRG